MSVPWQAGKGSATLSMAYAAAKFAESCLSALAGDPGVVECAYVDSHLTELPFFASPVRLGPNGVEVPPFPTSCPASP
jgi:malate dehydrogenase